VITAGYLYPVQVFPVLSTLEDVDNVVNAAALFIANVPPPLRSMQLHSAQNYGDYGNGGYLNYPMQSPSVTPPHFGAPQQDYYGHCGYDERYQYGEETKCSAPCDQGDGRRPPLPLQSQSQSARSPPNGTNNQKEQPTASEANEQIISNKANSKYPFIGKSTIYEMLRVSDEEFITDRRRDPADPEDEVNIGSKKLAFSYFQESWTMQYHLGQIREWIVSIDSIPGAKGHRYRGVETVRMPVAGKIVEYTTTVDALCSAGGVVARIQTPSMSIDIRSEFDGVVVEQMAAIGDTLEVGAPLIAVDTAKTAVAIFNSDLHFKGNGEVIYVVATPNDAEHSARQRWKVSSGCFLSAAQSYDRFGIRSDELPLSSREQLRPLLAAERRPDRLSERSVSRMCADTQWMNDRRVKKKSSVKQKCKHLLCGPDCTVNHDDPKLSRHCRCRCNLFETRTDCMDSRKCSKCGHHAVDHGIPDSELLLPTILITESALSECVRRSWCEDNGLFPAVVNDKSKRKTWIEWKKLVPIRGEDGEMYSVAISLKHKESPDNGCRGKGRRRRSEWSIECIDMDPGRVYYQHRLISDFVGDDLRMDFGALVGAITAKLKIVRG